MAVDRSSSSGIVAAMAIAAEVPLVAVLDLVPWL